MVDSLKEYDVKVEIQGVFPLPPSQHRSAFETFPLNRHHPISVFQASKYAFPLMFKEPKIVLDVAAGTGIRSDHHS